MVHWFYEGMPFLNRLCMESVFDQGGAVFPKLSANRMYVKVMDPSK